MHASRKTAARMAKASADDDFPPLTKAQLAELKRRVAEHDDPTRYLVVSAFSKRFALYYEVEINGYTHNRPEDATAFKSLDVAQAVLKALSKGRRHSGLQIIRARKTKTGLRLLEKPRDWLGDLVTARRRSKNRKLKIRNPKS